MSHDSATHSVAVRVSAGAGSKAARTFEMATSMIVPTAIAAMLAWAAVLGTDAALAVQHAVMIPAMLGVMLWRYEHYSSPH